MTKREYRLEQSDKLNELLEKMSLETGKSKEQLIREALEAFSFYEPPDSELVLAPVQGVACREYTCCDLDNQFNLRKNIKRNDDSPKITIHFMTGQILVIEPKTTWGKVKSFLSDVFK